MTFITFDLVLSDGVSDRQRCHSGDEMSRRRVAFDSQRKHNRVISKGVSFFVNSFLLDRLLSTGRWLKVRKEYHTLYKGFFIPTRIFFSIYCFLRRWTYKTPLIRRRGTHSQARMKQKPKCPLLRSLESFKISSLWKVKMRQAAKAVKPAKA